MSVNVIKHYIEYLSSEKHYSPQTVVAYENDIDSFCAFLGVDTHTFNPGDYDEEDVKMWIIHLLDECKYTARSVRRKISSLRGLYKYLLRMGEIKKNITKNIFLPKVPSQLPNYFREEEMRAVIAQEDDVEDFNEFVKCLIIEMFYQTGMRQAELLHLKDSDIDIVEGSVRVFGKRRKERIIPFGETLCNMIIEYRKRRDDILKEHTTSPSHSFWIRLNKKNEPVALTRFILYEYVCEKMGSVSSLKKHSPHVLRHTCATAMLDGGADIRTIQKLLGHATLTSTQIYTHVSFEKMKASYKKTHPRAKEV